LRDTKEGLIERERRDRDKEKRQIERQERKEDKG
jgi:hypothetical protein